MKKLSKLLSKKFNELHLLVQQAESVGSLDMIANGIESLEKSLLKRVDQVKEYVSSTESAELMDACLSAAFPEYRQVGKQVKTLELEDKEVKNVYSQKYLPFNTRDHDWLVQYMRKSSYRAQTKMNARKLALGQHPESLKEISLADIENYIENSKAFAETRDKYERNVVINLVNEQARISKEGSASWFRRAILNEVKTIGIDQHNAEVALERDPRWREQIFKNGFHDRINRNAFSLMIPKQAERAWLRANHYAVLVGLELVEKQAYECFKALREYEYYRWEKTKEVINELKMATPNMKMSTKEAQSMYKKFEELCEKYVAELRICRKIMERDPNFTKGKLM